MIKPLFKRILAFASIAMFVLSLPVASGIVLLSNGHIYEDTFLGGMKLKRDLLKNSEGKRIVFVGGSSLPFGLQSNLIEQELPAYHVVNFGLYGALGSEVMFDLALPYLHEGDVIILSIEQNEQTMSSYFSSRTLWRAIDNCKDAFFDLDETDRKRMVGDAFSFTSEKVSYLMQGKKAEGDGVYAYSSFTEKGDIKPSLTPYNVMYEGYDENQMVSFLPSVISDSFIDEMNDFALKAKKKGATTYYWFAPVNHAAVSHNRLVDSFYNDLNSRLSFPILGSPHDAIMNQRYFFDTNFHLNSSGSNNNSRRFVIDFKTSRQDDSPTSIELLPPPSSQGEGKKDGNNADLEFFILEEGETYCTITGLTEEGKNKASLVIPYSYHDKTIVSFEEETFQNNKSLQTIIIQDNIKTIPDRAFYGSSITRVELRNDTPSSVTCGNNLLNGSEANIYVPWYALSKYRSNYFWSSYSNRIFAFR